MDIADRAHKLEEQHRAAALEAAQTHGGDVAVMVNGKAHCCDCHARIKRARLIMLPEAARCVECQEIFEKQEQQKRRMHG